jgi:DNA ligase-4
MENEDEVCRYNGKPRFRIVDVIDKYSILKEDLICLNRHRYFRRVPFAEVIPEFDVALDLRRRLQPVDLFRELFTVEVAGAGFAKPANAWYYTLRFPRVFKVHNDLSFRGIISFKELREMVRRCLDIPDDPGTRRAKLI